MCSHPVAHVVVDEERRFHEFVVKFFAIETVSNETDASFHGTTFIECPRINEGSRRCPDEMRRAIPHTAITMAVTACHQFYVVLFAK